MEVLTLLGLAGLGLLARSYFAWRSSSEQRATELSFQLQSLRQRVQDLEAELRAGRRAAPGSGTEPAVAGAAPAPQGSPPPAPVSPLVTATAAAVTRAAPPPQPAAAPAAGGTSAQWPPASRQLPDWIRWFMGGNTLVRVGVIVLFFGVAFLLKFVAERVTFPIEARLTGAALGGLTLVALGWWLRHRRAGYALSLQGGGIGIFYITIYAAFRLYGLLPLPVALGLMLAIVAVAAALAVWQDALALALLGTLGGFLAPLLTSTGSGNVQLLLAYYVVLNLGVLGLAFAKTWRPLNLLGFAFTFLFLLVGVPSAFEPARFWQTGPYLWAFFVMYVGVAILYARHRALALKHYVDGTIVFGTPVLVFGLQCLLLRDVDKGFAYVAFLLAVLYLVLAAALRHRSIVPAMRLLSEAFLAIGVVFATLAVPLYFDARPTSALWALEGAAIVWIAVRQGRAIGQWFGVALQALAAAAFLTQTDWSVERPVFNTICLGFLLLAAGSAVAGRMIARTPREAGAPPAWIGDALYLVGVAWWLVGGGREILDFMRAPFEVPALVALLAVTVAGSLFARRRLEWPIALVPAALLLPALFALAALQVAVERHPFAGRGLPAWLLAFAVMFVFLRRHERDGGWMPTLAPWLHSATVWLGVGLLAIEAHWWTSRWLPDPETWRWMALLAVPAIALLGLTRAARGERWPFGDWAAQHLGATAPPIAAALVIGLLLANLASDGATVGPYLPLLNGLDLVGLLALFAIVGWHRAAQARGLALAPPLPAGIALGLLLFGLANAALLRALHHWAHIPYELHGMLQSQLVQTALTVFWSMIAVTTMFVATRRAQRPVWLAGALLLALVVVKLFVFDLSRLQGMGRIVAFLGVGVLLLAIGYFSPVPPRKAAEPPSRP
jgi:uncharacterized membrane protein